MNASSLLLLDRLSRVGVNASCTLRRTLTTTTTTAALQHSRRNASTASGPEVAYQDAAHFAGYQVNQGLTMQISLLGGGFNLICRSTILWIVARHSPCIENTNAYHAESSAE